MNGLWKPSTFTRINLEALEKILLLKIQEADPELLLSPPSKAEFIPMSREKGDFFYFSFFFGGGVRETESPPQYDPTNFQSKFRVFGLDSPLKSEELPRQTTAMREIMNETRRSFTTILLCLRPNCDLMQE